MKRLALLLALSLIPIMSIAQSKDSEGHILKDLWKTYYKAEQADRPQDQAKALEAIKAEAAGRRLAWDWYDAANRYVDVRASINWKDRRKMRETLDKEVEGFGEPVVVFRHYYGDWSSEKMEEYLKGSAAALKKSSNPEFWNSDSRIESENYGPVLLKLITNDWEYVLWSCMLGRGELDDEAESYYKGTYPQEALIEFEDLPEYWQKHDYKELEAYAAKYSGKAVGLLAKERLLSWRFYDAKEEESVYKALRADCAAFEKERRSYTGAEKQIADCCTGVKDLIETLDGAQMDVSVKDDVVTLRVRNVSSLRLQVKNGSKTVWEKAVSNPAPHYFVTDTITATVSGLPDGEYKVLARSGNCEAETNWDRSSLSIAVRRSAEGWGVFVADSQTGKPVSSCTLSLLDADRKTIVSQDGFRPDGFSPLPAKLAGALNGKDRYRALKATLTDKNGLLRSSGVVSLSGRPAPAESDNTEVQHAVIITDRGAYNPGEVVNFKAVCYTGTYEYKTVPEGSACTVTLFDSEDNEIEVKQLSANEFGSVCGSFTLPAKCRGGWFELAVALPGGNTASTSIRVDEFVLPTFDLTWDEDNKLYLSGDEIKVSGRIAAYSGHSLGSAKLRYSVGRDGNTESGTLTLGPGGTFAFSFNAGLEGWTRSYPVSVSVTDETGETLTFSTMRTVYSSLPFGLLLENKIAGTYTLIGGSNGDYGRGIVRDATADVNFRMNGLQRNGLSIKYKVFSDASGKEVASGSAQAGETVRIPIASLPSGLYRIEASATATTTRGSTSDERTLSFVKAADSDTALNMDVTSFFREFDAEDIALQIGTTDGPAWVVVELFGSGNVLLDSQIVQLKGERGKPGSLKTVSYTRKPGWSESLRLCAIFFHKGEEYRYNRSIKLPVTSLSLPLEFARFTEMLRPGERTSLLIKTEPGVECAATVFDKASEKIAPNRWQTVSPMRRPEPYVSYSAVCGVNSSEYPYMLYRAMDSKASGVVNVAHASFREEAPVEALDEESYDSAADAPEEVTVREDFAATMAWEPLLRSGEDGQIELDITGSDRLSTYYVQLFAHGAGMRNAVLRRELVVTIPVKVSLVQPLFLYEGDRYMARATIASTLEEDVQGTVAIRFYNGADWRECEPFAEQSGQITLPAGASVPCEAAVEVPSGLQTLGVMVKFTPAGPGQASDAVFVAIPVFEACQTLTEAHSTLLRSPSDREAALQTLRSQFVNIDSAALVPQERSILQMVKDAIPERIEPKGNDVLSLTEALYANALAVQLGAPGLSESEIKDLCTRIAACQNSGGGMAWFEGMSSSPVLTAAVLQRFASMPAGIPVAIDTDAAVKYLDSNRFSEPERPLWCGGLSLGQYLLTRAMYPGVPFEAPAGKALRQFKKDTRAYLVPGKKRGLNAQILAKATRLRTLQLLAASPEGQKLASAWGIKIRRCLLRSLDADIASLLQYAVEHKSGGYYYPNAVMPWRGLLESELYAHSLLCNLLTDYKEGSAIAEGIRLWLMVQKETQQWGTDAAYIEALGSVLRGTPQTLSASVLVLSGSYTKPFAEVRAAGNGFTVKCEYRRGGELLAEGDTLHVGDLITAVYSIWNEENRSFVRLTAPRPASLRPVQQLSGHYGWLLRPLSYSGWSISPQGYRNVGSTATEYWFDTYPEEDTSVSEELFVTQEGRFSMPAPVIESLYAPHYRANDDGRGPIVSIK